MHNGAPQRLAISACLSPAGSLPFSNSLKILEDPLYRLLNALPLENAHIVEIFCSGYPALGAV
jgi:hypothetical protein